MECKYYCHCEQRHPRWKAWDATRGVPYCRKCYRDIADDYESFKPVKICGNDHIVPDDDGGSAWHNAVRALEDF